MKLEIKSKMTSFLTPSRVIACFICSILFHLLSFVFIRNTNPFLKTSDVLIPQGLEVEFRDALDTFQETAENPPDEYSFSSSRNLKTDRETSPESSPVSIPEIGGGARKSSSRPETTRKEGAGDKTLFSLSQRDLSDVGEGQQRQNSPGFYHRLEKGQELKVNAREFDYGNYLLRMKEKLRQHWNPVRTIHSAMYNYNEIRVDIGVVLDEAGKIVELKLLTPSLFKNFDEEALRAFHESKNFPHPPASLVQDDRRVYMPWTFILTLRTWGMGASSVE